METHNGTWTKVLRVLEIVLFCGAFVLAIPAVPSEAGHVYRLTPVLAIGGSVFGAALFLGLRRGAETWITALVKLVFYGLFVWILQQRVAII